MTRTTNARIGGVTLILYFAAGIASLVLSGRAHATDVLSIVTSFSALVLGVTLYAITREQDPDLAMLALACRVIEAVPGNGLIYFAVGSTIFSWLLLRGRMIPAALAWLGVLGSAFLVVIPIPVLVPVVVMLFWLWRIRVRKTLLGIVNVGTPQVSGATK